jgi:hypothetical protein
MLYNIPVLCLPSTNNFETNLYILYETWNTQLCTRKFPTFEFHNVNNTNVMVAWKQDSRNYYQGTEIVIFEKLQRTGNHWCGTKNKDTTAARTVHLPIHSNGDK